MGITGVLVATRLREMSVRRQPRPSSDQSQSEQRRLSDEQTSACPWLQFRSTSTEPEFLLPAKRHLRVTSIIKDLQQKLQSRTMKVALGKLTNLNPGIGRSMNKEEQSRPTGLQDMPLELVLRISSLLATATKAALSMVSKNLYHGVGHSALLSLRQQPEEKAQFLRLLELDFPNMLHCPCCTKLYKWTRK